MSDEVKCADESDGMDMQKGQHLTSQFGKYLIKDLLGKGGYGAVYKVVLSGSDKLYALKAEKKVARRDHTKLNMEVFILKSMASQPEDKSHYARIYDKAKKSQFYMIVMTLLGESLSDLKKKLNPPIFTPNTGYAAATQSMEALEDLHKIHFIHRDLKPGNYAIGLPPRQHIIYILDFGIARRITKETGTELKSPRVNVPFKGTVRFAPLATHENKELSFKDDCESWMYMVVDMMNPKGVPWKMEKTKEAVGEMKAECRKTVKAKERLFHGLAVEEFSKGLDYLASLEYLNRPHYEFLYLMIRMAAQRDNVKMEPPFDWQPKKNRTFSDSSGSDSRSLRRRSRSGSADMGGTSRKRRSKEKSKKSRKSVNEKRSKSSIRKSHSRGSHENR